MLIFEHSTENDLEYVNLSRVGGAWKLLVTDTTYNAGRAEIVLTTEVMEQLCGAAVKQFILEEFEKLVLHGDEDFIRKPGIKEIDSPKDE